MSIRRPKQVAHLRSPSPDSDAGYQPYWYCSPSPEAAYQPSNYVERLEPFSWIRYYVLAIALALFAGIAFDMGFPVLKAVLQELPIISLRAQYMAKGLFENISWNSLCDGRTQNERDIQIDKETIQQLVFEVAAQFKEEREYSIQIDKETMRQIIFEVAAAAAQFKEASESPEVPTYELNAKDGCELAEVD
ncbi:hypothetical protein GALMADRAFT_253343 [Galerina marginata CBS 339.88]|uniref:Uncharacterized protein n=1 Tax=Galerina marginata (strain CBS 339.88) TaxID=685588 RepID=A0A067SZ97_GALM3|nr:hypothetical protein GALMADRAFT_253343 [Galerina marginata CBS 339.88]